jgi:hypothetical protein
MMCHLATAPINAKQVPYGCVHTSINPFALIGSGTTAENAAAVDEMMTDKTKNCPAGDTTNFKKRIVTYHHGHEASGVNHRCKLSGSSLTPDADRTCSCMCSTGGL